MKRRKLRRALLSTKRFNSLSNDEFRHKSVRFEASKKQQMLSSEVFSFFFAFNIKFHFPLTESENTKEKKEEG